MIDIETQNDSSQKTNQNDDFDNTFTQDHIPDLNRWLENSKVPSNEFIEINLGSDENKKQESNNDENDLIDKQKRRENHQNSTTKQSGRIKYLNLNYEQINGKQLQILASLSYLTNEQRLSVLVCKLKLPFFKNQQFPLYRRNYNWNTNPNQLRLYQQIELIKQTKYIFVKSYLIDSLTRKRISKKKKYTSLLPIDGENTILNNNPYDQNKYIIINEMMIFNLRTIDLSKITIRLTIFGLSSLTNLRQQFTNQSNSKIKKSIDTLYSFGTVEIGTNSLSKSAFQHYQNFLNNPSKPICMWHSLENISKQSKRKNSSSF